MTTLCEIIQLKKQEQKKFLDDINNKIKNMSIENRIIWNLNKLPKNHILSSSFGIQSSVLLHLVTKHIPKIPVVLIDTGYLFSDTYRYIDKMVAKLQLNLYIFRSKISPRWQEARYGKLWEQKLDGINLYNKINKIIPMKKSLKVLKVKTWIAGLRRQQSTTRSNLSFLSIQNKIFKFLPILDWDNNMIFSYIKKNNLDMHPLWKKNYRSVGDIHTTRKWKKGELEENTRFFGLKRECGIHYINK
ncbi:phosphoadenylyl-sulfate reductase [Buchnera aphidicola (Kurisakia onigurumii)]|uniref:phosphoadenylyl-sulfate reductase n=1 Tax=Buchnera aphidicola TaxID=9 RepID=UPI0031B7226C